MKGPRGVATGRLLVAGGGRCHSGRTVWVGDTRNNRLAALLQREPHGTPPIAVVTGGGSVGAVQLHRGRLRRRERRGLDRRYRQQPSSATTRPARTFTAFGTRGIECGDRQPGAIHRSRRRCGRSGDFYVADTGNNRIDEVDMNGNLVAVFKTGLNEPQGIAIGLGRHVVGRQHAGRSGGATLVKSLAPS